MRADDLDRVLDIERRVQATPWSRGMFAHSLAAGHECRVADASPSALIGYGILSLAADEAMLLALAVAPERQRAGHGRALARHLIGRARRAGAAAVLLEVRDSNAAAIALYESLGFALVGRRSGYYTVPCGGREDARVMRLRPL